MAWSDDPMVRIQQSLDRAIEELQAAKRLVAAGEKAKYPQSAMMTAVDCIMHAAFDYGYGVKQ